MIFLKFHLTFDKFLKVVATPYALNLRLDYHIIFNNFLQTHMWLILWMIPWQNWSHAWLEIITITQSSFEMPFCTHWKQWMRSTVKLFTGLNCGGMLLFSSYSLWVLTPPFLGQALHLLINISQVINFSCLGYFGSCHFIYFVIYLINILNLFIYDL